MSGAFTATLGALVPITNPVFVLAAYVGLTESFSRRAVRRQALLTGLYSFLTLATFTLLGTRILHLFAISWARFRSPAAW